MIHKILLLVAFIWLLQITTIQGQINDKSENSPFEFVFMTDIHIRPDMNAPEGFQMAIDAVNQLNPDFVLTGGDLIFDALRGNQQRSDSLYNLFIEISKGFKMPLYPCLGNHDLFAVYEESPEDNNHPDYKYGMFERYFGDSYYSFDHKGWHFIVLNSLDVTADHKVRGYVHDAQMKWLEDDLKKIGSSIPIVVVSHIPLVSAWRFVKSSGNEMVENSTDVFKLFDNHNLKLVLQGHIHWKEYGFINDQFHYITGGSIAGNGWKGRRHNTKEGFVYIKVNCNDIEWQYIDHGWENERLKKVGL